MAKSVKCNACGAWNTLEDSDNQKCVNCEEIVQDPAKERAEKIKKHHQEQLDNWMFTIKEEDSPFKKRLKKVGNITYLIIMSIVGFFAWLVASLPV